MHRLVPSAVLVVAVLSALVAPATAQDDSGFRVIRLQHQRADRLQQTLRNFLREDQQARNQMQASRPDLPRQRSLVMAAHDGTNSLVISGSQDDFLMLEKLIASLDTPAGTSESAGEATRLDARIDDTSVELVPDASGGTSLAELVAVLRSVDSVAVQYVEPELPHTRIPLVGSVKVPRERFFELFQTLIHPAGLGCIARRTGAAVTVEIRQVTGNRNTPTPAPAPARYTPADRLDDAAMQGSHVFTAVRLEHLNATYAARELQQMLGSQVRSQDGVRVSSMADQRVVLLRGFVPWVRDAVAILRDLDVPRAAEQESIVHDLEHARPPAVVEVLVALFGSDSEGSRFRAVACGRSRIALTGPTATVAEALEVVERLDVADGIRGRDG